VTVATLKLPGQLERSVLFGSLDEKARRDIAAFAKPRSFSTGEPIFRLGDRGDSMMAVVVGTVRISLPTTRGKEVHPCGLAGRRIVR
jgi:CRP-like cAMP-binding protein